MSNNLGMQTRSLISRAHDYRLRERPDNEILDDLLQGLEAFLPELDRHTEDGQCQ